MQLNVFMVHRLATRSRGNKTIQPFHSFFSSCYAFFTIFLQILFCFDAFSFRFGGTIEFRLQLWSREEKRKKRRNNSSVSGVRDPYAFPVAPGLRVFGFSVRKQEPFTFCCIPYMCIYTLSQCPQRPVYHLLFLLWLWASGRQERKV